MPNKSEAQAYLQSVAIRHVPSNARQYNWRCYNGERSVSSGLGFQIDLSPVDGKVVEKNADWLVVKIARTEFFVASVELLDVVPDIGDTVHIEPYARRGFDGIRLDAPKKIDYGNGVVMQSFTLGENISHLPIDKKKLQSEYLKQLIDQVERLDSPDGVRKLCQVLVDAGAYLGPVTYHDPADSDCIAVPPSLNFVVKTDKFDGVLQIAYDRGIDYYHVNLFQDDHRVHQLVDIAFTELASTILDLVDDGKWRLAKVTVTKRAKPVKKAA